ncbi:MAG: prepilin-type N-terminal cleavage/methylation protein [Acidobacteria bacterium]|nr:prepilin-type N-terminal cleavage/methylation protein [Acidobacteriota bacterium]
MNRRSEQYAVTGQRGDTIKVVRSSGHRVVVSGSGASASRGFTLIELVIAITVMTILTLGVVPLVKMAVKRQREQQLREALRTMRSAIDQFHREALIYNCNLQTTGQQQQQQQQQLPVDPRIKVAITDCTIFGVDNPDRFPPDLETLVSGVNVIPISGSGGRGQPGVNATQVGQLATKKKVYLRELPIDPMTGNADWDLRSCYDAGDSDSWGGENVFDVRSKSKGTALNGEKYSDW